MATSLLSLPTDVLEHHMLAFLSLEALHAVGMSCRRFHAIVPRVVPICLKNIQKRVFTNWTNLLLLERLMKIQNILDDFADGLLLLHLVEILSSKTIKNYHRKPSSRAQYVENVSAVLNFLLGDGLKNIRNISAEDIIEGNVEKILALIWELIKRYQFPDAPNMLQWLQNKIPECNLKNFTSSWRSGRPFFHLCASLKPSSVELPLTYVQDQTPLQNATAAIEVAEAELGIPSILTPQDLIDAEPRSILLYAHYFYYYERNSRVPCRMGDYTARMPDPSKCRAFGPGLTSAETGVPSEFTIQAVNVVGKDIPVGGEEFEVKVNGPFANSAPVVVRVFDQGNGTYRVVYAPSECGMHKVSMCWKGKPLQQSPLFAMVERVLVHPPFCLVYGPGLETGQPSTWFHIEARDRYHLRIRFGGDLFHIRVIGPSNTEVTHQIKDAGGGYYNVTYQPVTPGTHLVHVTFDGIPVNKSPWTVPIDTISN